MTRLNPVEYDTARRLLEDSTGIDLGENKQTLVESRLMGRLLELNLKSYSEYLRIVVSDKAEQEYFINSMTTNKTDWFREPDHFEIMKSLLASYQARSLYLWSAACSTGEEPYSVAMSLRENVSEKRRFRLLATDVDTDVICHAERGMYRDEVVSEQVPSHIRLKYFERQGDMFGVRPEIKEDIKFRRHNLIEGMIPKVLQFDIIFLRNVLIYFAPATIDKVINALIQNLKCGGYLFIGHAEALTNKHDQLTLISNSIYQKKAK